MTNSTAVITNAFSLFADPTCLLIEHLCGKVVRSLAITWYLYEHVQKVRRESQEAEDLKEPIFAVLPIETSLWKGLCDTGAPAFVADLDTIWDHAAKGASRTL